MRFLISFFRLIGTKSDLRNDQTIIDKLNSKNQKMVEESEAIKFAKNEKCVGYFEISALESINLEEVINAAITASCHQNSTEIVQESKKCNIQ